MNIAIYYYSSTGNTKLTCQYITKNIRNANFDLFDIVSAESVDLTRYQVVGFVTPTMFMGIPWLFSDFIAQLSCQSNKPAFVLNTYGMMSGKTLKLLEQEVTAKGFKVVAGHSFLTPENYPPFIVKGWGNENAPDEKALVRFNSFIAELDDCLAMIADGQMVERTKIKTGLLNRLMRSGSVAKAKKEIGALFVDKLCCSGCGKCHQVCPSHAIDFDGKPVFKADQCHGCWTCFNRCPEKAIFTPKINGTGHYPHPNEQFASKLSN